MNEYIYNKIIMERKRRILTLDEFILEAKKLNDPKKQKELDWYKELKNELVNLIKKSDLIKYDKQRKASNFWNPYFNMSISKWELFFVSKINDKRKLSIVLFGDKESGFSKIAMTNAKDEERNKGGEDIFVFEPKYDVKKDGEELLKACEAFAWEALPKRYQKTTERPKNSIL